jgi:group I intron endonuclease
MSNILSQDTVDLTDFFGNGENHEGIIDGKIYRITNTITKKVYIGQTKSDLRKRWWMHIAAANANSQCYIHRAMRKYGIENFVIEQVDFAKFRSELNIKEDEWVVRENSMAPNGYNLIAGGRAHGISDETRQKLRDANLGKKPSEETRKKLSIAGKGRPAPSEETRKKLSIAKKGRKVSPETRKLISDSRKGKSKGLSWFYNPETKERKMLYADQDIPKGFIKTRGHWYHNPKTGIKALFCLDDDVPEDFIRGAGRWYRKPSTGEKLYISCENDVPEGFIFGRLNTKEETKMVRQRSKGCSLFYNPETKERKMLLPDSEIPEGFISGENTASEETRKKLSESSIGCLFYHNPDLNKTIRLRPNEPIPEGFIRGKLKNQHSSHNANKKWFYNPETKERISLFISEPIPEGFIPGMGKNELRKDPTISVNTLVIQSEEIKCSNN